MPGGWRLYWHFAKSDDVVIIPEAREMFDTLGFDAIPLRAGSKIAIRRGWQSAETYQQWRGINHNVNLGLRGGGPAGLAVLDCDEKNQPGTFDKATSWLASMGYCPGDYPVIQTASGVGRHIYTTLDGTLPGDYRILSSDFGAGEFRYGSGAYVAAPPSTIDGAGGYELLSGDYRQLPKICLADVLPILSSKEIAPIAPRPNLPRKAISLMHGNIEGFSSRSEAEQSLVVSLINAGHDFQSVLSIFLSNPCAGKFRELRAQSDNKAIGWLKRSYDEAATWASSHTSPARQLANDAIDWASARAWPGRTGSVDKSVFVAHCQIASRAGKEVYAASCRDLAELSNVGSMTAARSTNRLVSNGLLIIDTPSMADCASIYRLNAKIAHTDTLPKNTDMRKCISMGDLDVWRRAGLGKSAMEVYMLLSLEALTVKQLSMRTGRGASTVKRVLEVMSTRIIDGVTGELIPMVAKEGSTWKALPCDLEHIAQIVGTAGAGDRQKAKHRLERRSHRRGLDRMKHEKA